MPHKDPVERAAYIKAYTARNAERANARSKAWYLAHRDDPGFKATKAERNEKWKAANREKHLATRRAYRKRRYADPTYRAAVLAEKAIARSHLAAVVDSIVAEAKGEGCPCGERVLVALDLHHVDPTTKAFSVGQTRYMKLHRVEEIREEVAKCVPLCANCHRKQQSLLRPRRAGFYGRAQIVLDAKRPGCQLCGEPERVCLGFHHRDPSAKLFKISDHYKKGITREMLVAEIAKCALLCENCHRKVHAGLVELPA